jgi:hypothetical protein
MAPSKGASLRLCRVGPFTAGDGLGITAAKGTGERLGLATDGDLVAFAGLIRCRLCVVPLRVARWLSLPPDLVLRHHPAGDQCGRQHANDDQAGTDSHRNSPLDEG